MFELESWAKKLTQLWSQRFDALDEVLKAEKKKVEEVNKKDE